LIGGTLCDLQIHTGFAETIYSIQVHLYSTAKKVQLGTQNPSELASIITTQSTSEIKPHSTATMLLPIARFHGGKKFTSGTAMANIACATAL
jgi:hypothetical protein